jgi:uncharacterized protein (TIGR02444 family)
MSNLDARDAQPLWQFSLAVYAMPGVQAECLTLQDTHGIDVNVLLYCAWVGACGCRRLAAEDIGRAREAVAAWHSDVVLPLRSARKNAKRLDERARAARDAIAEAELAAERVEQDLLFGLAAPANPANSALAHECVRCNIGLLLAHAGACNSPFPQALAGAALAYGKAHAPNV